MARVEVAERVIAQIWKRQLLDAGNLITSSNDALTVVYPGRENRDRGPDFLDAIILTGGRRAKKGDVEIHSRARDWRIHGHDRDYRYNRVILQVVWEGEAEAVLESGGRVPTLPLSKCLNNSLDNIRRQLQFPEVPGEPCHGAAHRLGKRATGELLDEAGEERFLCKTSFFAAEIEREPPPQVLYAGIMDALGYSKNKEPFRELARSLPLAVLERICRGKPGGDQVRVLKALLLGRAGFLGDGADEGLRRIWQRLGDGQTMEKRRWRVFRVRPENHPARRLVGAAYLLARVITCGLLEETLRSMEVDPADIKRIERGFVVRASVAGSNGQSVLIGEGRAREIVVNVVLPFASAFFEANGQSGPARRTRALYRRYPRAGEYGVTRELAGLLTGGRTSQLVNSALRQQGLLHIDRTYCRPRRCAGCPVATRLNAKLLAG